MLLVHHGIFWQKDSYQIIGSKHKKIQLLLDNSINLFAYHLPLDCHAKMGNNILIGKLLNCERLESIHHKLPNILLEGYLTKACSFEEFEKRLYQKSFSLHLLASKPHTREIKKLAWCSGAGESFFEEAVRSGADAFLTGEMSEKMVHSARESGCHFFACGHHATENSWYQSFG